METSQISLQIDFGNGSSSDLPLPVGPTNLPRFLDAAVYAAGVAEAEAAYSATPGYVTAIALTKALIHAALDAASPETGVMISNSWGKDSTAMLGVYTEVLIDRKREGRSIPRTLVVTADTGSEFIDMQVRTGEESARLTEWAKKEGLPIECHLVRPSAKDGLLANLIGGGKPLPKYSNSKKGDVAEWCVDRLKVGPIQKSIQLAKDQCPYLLHFLGVRTGESTRRAGNIAEHSSGLPFGLTRVSMNRRKAKSAGGESVPVIDEKRIGVQPIVHWNHEDLTVFMRINMAPWNAFSYESLKEVYRRAAGPKDINGAGECRISLTKDGGVSNTCSDLSGSRFGCLMCVKSKNMSLQHYAQKDKRYRWIRAAHKYLYNGIRQHQGRLKDIKAAGFDGTTFFPKTYLFSWRVRLLAIVYRAEIDSGFVLIDPAAETAIAQWWQRSGVFSVRPSDIKADVLRWIETGRLSFAHEAAAGRYEDLSVSLGEGLPGGMYAHVLFPGSFIQSLEMANIMALAGSGNGIYPSLRAYVFRDLSSRGGWLTMITDTPSDMGRRVNTSALNGFSGFALELVGVRDVTEFEIRLLRGRTVFYRHAEGVLESRIEKMAGVKWSPGCRADLPYHAAGLGAIMMANLNLCDPCGEHAYADWLYEGNAMTGLRDRVTGISMKRLMALVTDAVGLSDALSTRHEGARAKVLRGHRAMLDRLGSSSLDSGDSVARAAVKVGITKNWDIRDSAEAYLSYIDVMRDIMAMIAAGQANPELVNRLAYIVRTSLYDATHAEELMDEVLRLIMAPGQLAAA